MNPVKQLRIKVEKAHDNLQMVNKTLQEIHTLLLDIEREEKNGFV